MAVHVIFHKACRNSSTEIPKPSCLAILAQLIHALRPFTFLMTSPCKEYVVYWLDPPGTALIYGKPEFQQLLLMCIIDEPQ
jgi:hypothetical protein